MNDTKGDEQKDDKARRNQRNACRGSDHDRIGCCSRYGFSRRRSVSYNNVKVNVSGEIVGFKDERGNKVNPILIDGTTYIPLRGIAEQLGHAVAWDKSENIIYVKESDSSGMTHLKSETVRNQELEESIKKVIDLASNELL